MFHCPLLGEGKWRGGWRRLKERWLKRSRWLKTLTRLTGFIARRRAGSWREGWRKESAALILIKIWPGSSQRRIKWARAYRFSKCSRPERTPAPATPAHNLKVTKVFAFEKKAKQPNDLAEILEWGGMGIGWVEVEGRVIFIFSNCVILSNFLFERKLTILCEQFQDRE